MLEIPRAGDEAPHRGTRYPAQSILGTTLRSCVAQQRISPREQSTDMPFQCPVVVGFAPRRPLLAEFARFGRCARHAGRQNDANLRAMLADGLSQLEALAVVALDVEEGEVELHVEAERLDGFLVRAGLDDIVAALAQIRGQRRAHQDVTVNEQQSGWFQRSLFRGACHDPATGWAGDLFHGAGSGSRWPNSDVAEQKIDTGPLQRPRPAMTARYRKAAANDSGPRYRIMIVQDDFLLRMETGADLRRWGYDVVEAFNEADAGRVLQADRRIALVLLDVNVGGSQRGLALARRIKDHYPEMKLLLTAAVAPTADDIPVLDKPYRPIELLQHIDALLTAQDSDPSRGEQH